MAVRERLLSLSVCRVTRVTHSALSAYSRPDGLGRRYTNPQIELIEQCCGQSNVNAFGYVETFLYV
jgi:hypothetical protein